MNVASSQADSVGVRELKNQLSAYLDRVKAGDEITVTEHGWPVARLTAVRPDTDQLARLVEAGIVRPAAEPRRRLPKRRVRLHGDGPSATELVHEYRR